MTQLVASSSFGLIGTLIYLAVIALEIAGWWMILTKAGRPGWGALIPIYNLYLLCKVAGRPGWWVILFFVPLVNIVITIWVCIDVAMRFRKGAGFGIGLAILGVVFAPILGFGEATYIGTPTA